MDLVSNKVDTGGKRLNLFPAKKQKKKLPVDDKVFNMMEAVADKSYVNISDMSQLKVEKSTKSIHNALMAAGMTPAYGNIADVADATLYALEGEFGEAAWSMAAAIPIIGQMVAGRKAAKVAKEAGEKMVTLYRGVSDWFPGKMVKKGKFIGGRHSQWDPNIHKYSLPKGSISVSAAETESRVQRKIARKEAKEWARDTEENYLNRQRHKKIKKGLVLEFEMPLSEWKKLSVTDVSIAPLTSNRFTIFPPPNYIIHKGIPKEFLKKVHNLDK